jgi:DNA-binding beta-propeller fold protein YncE
LFVSRHQYVRDMDNTYTFSPIAENEYNGPGTFVPVPNAFKPGSALKMVDLKNGAKVTTILDYPGGSSSLRGLAISPDGKYVYVTHIMGRYKMVTTQVDRGWMNTNLLTVINTANQEIVNSVLLDDLDIGAPNPWGVKVSSDGSFLVVTHAGSHEISLINRLVLHEKLQRVAGGEQVTMASIRPEDVPNDFSFLVGLRQRIRLKGNRPRGVAIAGNKIFVTEYFSGSMSVVELNGLHTVRSIDIGEEPEMNKERQGYMIFNDATHCSQLWQSCASCHPDSRADGLNWNLMNIGLSKFRNTKSLLYSHFTPPAM